MLDPQLAFIQVPLQLAEQLPVVVVVVVTEVDPSALHVAVHPVPEEVVLLHAEEPHVPVAVVANPKQKFEQSAPYEHSAAPPHALH